MRLFLLQCLTLLAIPACANIADHYKPIENKTAGHTYGPIEYIYLINLDHRPEKYEQSVNEFKRFGIHPFRFSAVHGFGLSNTALQEIGSKYHSGMRGGAVGTVFRWNETRDREYESHEMIEEEGTTYFCHCLARGTIGILMSHASILHDAYQSGYELVWILEDDAEVVDHPRKILQCIKELDKKVGRDHWDIFFTDVDYRYDVDKYHKGGDADFHPSVDTRRLKLVKPKKISDNLRRVGTRLGGTSMIWTRKGMKKYLDHLERHGMYLPYDMDYYLAPGIRLFTPTFDIVTNRLKALSDNGFNKMEIVPKKN